MNESLHYQPKLPDTFETTDLLELLFHFKTDIHYEDPHLIKQIIKPQVVIPTTSTLPLYPEIFPDTQFVLARSDTQISRNIIFTPIQDTPAILEERGANNCSLLLTLDSEGKAILIHFPFINGIGNFNKPTSITIEKYMSFAKTHFPEENLSILTATNPLHLRSIHARKLLIELLKESLPNDGRLITLLVNQNSSRFLNRTTTCKTKETTHLKSFILPPMDVISSLIFIPRQLTTTDHNEIFIS